MFFLKPITQAALLMLASAAYSQVATPPIQQPPLLGVVAPTSAVELVPAVVGYKQFLQLVQKNNLVLAAQKSQIDIADAQIALAALFPDPTITTGVSAYEMSKDKLPTISTLALNFTLEGGRKRQVRTEAAQADKARAEADFVRQMMSTQLDATQAYIDHLRAKASLRSWQAALGTLERLEQHSQKRTEKPDGVLQAQLLAEKLRAQAEQDAASADVYISSRAMLGFAQASATDLKRFFEGKGDLEMPVLEGYQNRQRDGLREDVIAAQKTLDAASKREELSRENRSLDMNFNIGVNHARAGEYLSTPFPQSNSLIAQLTVPIPFSLRQDGDLRAASAVTAQATKQYQDVLQRAGLEAEQAQARYAAAWSQLQKYSASAEATARSLRSYVEQYLVNKAELGDVIVLLKLNNESNSLRIEAQANHARSMAALLAQARELSLMPFENR